MLELVLREAIEVELVAHIGSNSYIGPDAGIRM